MPVIYLIIAAVSALVVLAVIVVKLRQLSVPPSEDRAPAVPADNKQLKLMLWITGGVVIVFAVLVVVFEFMNNETAGEETSTNMVIFVPIWFAALIPLFGARQAQSVPPNKKMLFAVLVGLGTLLILAAVVFILMR